MKIPPLAGWPGESVDPSPFRVLYLVHEDLKEIEESPELLQSEAWLNKFGNNLKDLKEYFDTHHQNTSDVTIYAIQNWIENARENHQDLSMILENPQKNLSLLKKFVKELVKNDRSNFDLLLHNLNKALEEPPSF